MVGILKDSDWLPATEYFAGIGTADGLFSDFHGHMKLVMDAVGTQKAVELMRIGISGFSKPEVPEGAREIFISHKEVVT
jgi:hypothetical protein